MLDGSRELALIIGTLYRKYDAGPFSHDALTSVLRERVTSLSSHSASRLDAYVAALVRCGYLVRDEETAGFRISERSAAFARSNAPLTDFALSPGQEREFFSRLSSNGEVVTIPAQELHAVTRKFLEEVLDEAAIDPELLDVIVFTYQLEGKLTMSEDGGRYTITLPE